MAEPRSASSAPESCFGHDLGIHGIAARTENVTGPTMLASGYSRMSRVQALELPGELVLHAVA